MQTHRSTFSVVLAAVLFLGGVLSPWVHRLQHAESAESHRIVASVVDLADRSPAADGDDTPGHVSPASHLVDADGAEADLHHCFWCQFHVTGWPEASGADHTLPRVVDAVSDPSRFFSFSPDRRLSIRGPPGVSPAAVLA